MSSAACRGNGRDARARVSNGLEDNDFLRSELDACDCCGAAFEEGADVGQGRRSARPAPRSRSCWVELPLLALHGKASVPCLRASLSRRLASTNQRGRCVPRPEPRLTKAVRRTGQGETRCAVPRAWTTRACKSVRAHTRVCASSSRSDAKWIGAGLTPTRLAQANGRCQHLRQIRAMMTKQLDWGMAGERHLRRGSERRLAQRERHGRWPVDARWLQTGLRSRAGRAHCPEISCHLRAAYGADHGRHRIRLWAPQSR